MARKRSASTTTVDVTQQTTELRDEPRTGNVPATIEHPAPPADFVFPETDLAGGTIAGTMVLSQAAQKVLRGDIPDELLEILPSGEVYAPQTLYRQILLDVFGPGGWGLRALNQPTVQNNAVIQQFALVVGGRVIAEAWGECDYQPSNKRMGYTDAIEGAKSEALKRCCKDLGIAAKCWDPGFCEEWREKYAVKTRHKDENRPQWRRKDRAPHWKEVGIWSDSPNQGNRTQGNPNAARPPQRAGTGSGPTPQQQTTGAPATAPGPYMSPEERRMLFAVARKAGHDDQQMMDWIKATYKLDSTKNLPASKIAEVKARLEDPTPLTIEHEHVPV